MDKVSITLRTLFDERFYIGVFERMIDNKLYVSKVTFGSEPSDNEIFDYINNHYYSLMFSPAVETNCIEKRINPKRMNRIASKQISSSLGTKSQQALKLLQEEKNLQRKIILKEELKLKKEKIYLLKQEKKKMKHKGR